MQTGVNEKHGQQNLISWLSPLGESMRLMSLAFTPASFKRLDWPLFKAYCHCLGLRSFHHIALSSVVISIALTIQTILELQNYRAQDLSGAVISVGILRELAALTVSTTWCASVAALIASECKWCRPRWLSKREFAETFLLPRYLATLAMALPLSAYGLIIGFVTGAFYAPILNVISRNDFFESARLATQNKDIVVFFVKLAAVNPTIGVLAGCTAGLSAKSLNDPVEANAVTATALCCYILNLGITAAAYLGGPNQ